MKYEWSLWLKLLVCQVCDLNSQKLVSWYFCWTWSLYQVLDLKSLKYLDWTNVVPVECQVSVWPPLELLTDWACWTSGDSRSSLAVCHLHPRPQRAVRAGQFSRSGLTLSLRAVTGYISSLLVFHCDYILYVTSLEFSNESEMRDPAGLPASYCSSDVVKHLYECVTWWE